MSAVIRAAVVALGVLTASAAPADPIKCQRTIVKESAKYRATAVEIVNKCKEAVIAKTGGVPSAVCPSAADQTKIDAAFAKLQAKIAGACGGADRTCGTPDDEPLAAIRWDVSHCLGLEGQCGAIPITSCASIGTCLRCIGDYQVEASLDGLLYDEFEDGAFFPANGAEPARSVNRCQVAIAKSAAKFLGAKEKALNKCWDAKLRGKAGFADDAPCPDTDPNPGSGTPPASPGDNKTVEAIKKAEQKKVHAICRACGAGGDADRNGVCDAPPGVALDDLVEGVPFTCPDVSVPPNAVHPGGLDCGAIGVTDLPSYVACVDCVLEFRADCAAAAGVGDDAPADGIDYPSQCSPIEGCPVVPTRYEFTANGDDADYDVGWVGVVHDQAAVANARLTLAIGNCMGGPGGCGQCSLAGPITNDGGPGLANRRCLGDATGANGSWIECTSDAQCPGAGNGCVYFFGPPQPVGSSGAEVCVVNVVTGPLTGTVNVDTGEAAFTGAWAARIHAATIAVGTPCARCVAGICDGGPRDGESCLVSGSSTLFADDLSYDCPPDPTSTTITYELDVPFSTGTQSRSISPASPQCTAFGYASRRCMCDTCDDGAATPCSTSADCAPGGVCGGLRCLVGSGAGTGMPCTTIGQNTDPVCGQVGPGACSGGSCVAGPHPGVPCDLDEHCAGVCGVPGEPTKPNACSNATCTPRTPPDTDSINEGRCATGPTLSYCNVETYRGCASDADCAAPACPDCSPGQTCVFDRYACFTDNGMVGGTVSVGGVASTTAPTLGALYCVGSGAGGYLDGTFGLPGLARVTIPGTVSIE